MAELLTLTTPETFPSITTWKIAKFFIDVDAPSVKVELVSNTGVRYDWKYIVGPGVTLLDVKNAITFINAGNFKTQNKTLQQWLLEQISLRGAKIGTVTP